MADPAKADRTDVTEGPAREDLRDVTADPARADRTDVMADPVRADLTEDPESIVLLSGTEMYPADRAVRDSVLSVTEINSRADRSHSATDAAEWAALRDSVTRIRTMTDVSLLLPSVLPSLHPMAS